MHAKQCNSHCIGLLHFDVFRPISIAKWSILLYIWINMLLFFLDPHTNFSGSCFTTSGRPIANAGELASAGGGLMAVFRATKSNNNN